ncbi:ribosomal protein L23, putative [Plasmodium reichenowi]|uniref:Ribosomal protein L23, putative n=1 Tax=Plasmodium reichenowi TaxID=5854 RepID=A0A060S0L2_PLARE|nr:ribosomal protein L23, putative [Plasmodium reichenowi]KYO03638.1 ribosomal protein L23, putative [Plasmodium reichenowi]CDO67254.1 ribosomal protein L23, putative [Plasmodium reichenowi]
MKEVILNFYLYNILFYKINFLNKFCIIYSIKYFIKSDIKYIIKNIFKIKLINYNNIKINNINKKDFLKKYYITFK